jgi:hypothetical protein
MRIPPVLVAFFHVDRRMDVTNLVEGKRFAKTHNTPVGYDLKIAVFKPSETNATLAGDSEAAMQCHGHFCITSLDCMW